MTAAAGSIKTALESTITEPTAKTMQVPAGGGAAAPAAAEEPNTIMSTVVRGLLMYFAFSIFLKRSPEAETSGGATAVAGGDGVIEGEGAGSGEQVVAPKQGGTQGTNKPYSNLFKLGQEMDLDVFLSGSEDDYDFADKIWSEQSIFYDWQDVR